MEGAVPGRLAGWEIHGFRTMEDLDMQSIMEEATSRWLRSNEIHAILCNYKYFSINVKPVNLPKSGTIVLFDRKMIRNFRKDGHNWKKKTDGKTLREAHEQLKVGNKERIHVYYAHGQDHPTFVRRCYWLLDKSLEHIVLVHYRETQELQGSPVMPVISNTTSWNFSEELDSVVNGAYDPVIEQHTEPTETIETREMRLREINTLEWDELLASDVPNISIASEGGKFSPLEQQNQCEINGNRSNIDSNSELKDSEPATVGTNGSLDILDENGLQTEDSLGKWLNDVMIDSPGSVYDPPLESSISISPVIEHQQPSGLEYLFTIKDVSPAWALSTEETKIIVVGFFSEENALLENSYIFCVCGDSCVPAELVQTGVYRCLVKPHNPGLVNLYLSFDGQNPISQTVSFEYRTPITQTNKISSQDNKEWQEFQLKMRLAHLLFSTSKSLRILSSKVPQKSLLEAKEFARKTSHIPDKWKAMIKSIEENRVTYPEAKDGLFELILQNRLHEWLLENIIEGCKICDYDDQGQGVIHLCAVMDYTWAVYPFSWSGISLDHRDKYGWTPLHWAACYGREKMVATLLSAGAKPNLVTDPTSKDPAGRTAADLALMNGYDGLSAYLAEKALIQQFSDMAIAGNVTGLLQSSSENPRNLTDEELYLKESLSAYRTAADAAARIQVAIREHSLKIQIKAARFFNTEDEARSRIAVMKIQHAYRNHESRKKMAAAVRIQYRFHTWKIRKDFVNMRQRTIKVQAVYRGFQVRKQYRKIVWSVGVVEKAILRWRLKRKGFRGLNVKENKKQESFNEEEEYFFKVSRKQAEERVERSVVKVQAMFRSKQAQEEYRRIKVAHNQAKLEYDGLSNAAINMDQ